MRYYLAAVFIMLGFCLSAYGQTGTMGENISLGTTNFDYNINDGLNIRVD